MRFGARRGKTSWIGRKLKRQRDGDVQNGERAKLKSFVWVWRTFHRGKLGVFVSGQRAGRRENGAGGKSVRLGRKRKFFCEGRNSFCAQE